MRSFQDRIVYFYLVNKTSFYKIDPLASYKKMDKIDLQMSHVIKLKLNIAILK